MLIRCKCDGVFVFCLLRVSGFFCSFSGWVSFIGIIWFQWHRISISLSVIFLKGVIKTLLFNDIQPWFAVSKLLASFIFQIIQLGPHPVGHRTNDICILHRKQSRLRPNCHSDFSILSKTENVEVL